MTKSSKCSIFVLARASCGILHVFASRSAIHHGIFVELISRSHILFNLIEFLWECYSLVFVKRAHVRLLIILILASDLPRLNLKWRISITNVVRLVDRRSLGQPRFWKVIGNTIWKRFFLFWYLMVNLIHFRWVNSTKVINEKWILFMMVLFLSLKWFSMS